MIIKTFAISQLIFSSQFQVIQPKDVRKIEHLCYMFAWNGRDRVRRGVLKSERHQGGINGTDIESFFKSIAIRQYIKSYSDKRLNILNNSSIIKEDIKLISRATIRKIFQKQLRQCDLEYPNEIEWVIKAPISYFVKANSRAHSFIESLPFKCIGQINFDNLPRVLVNKIRRCLHQKYY